MSGRDADVVARLAEQRDHQIRVAEARRPWWITGLFLLGACVSILGLKLSFQTLPQDGLTFRIIGFGVFTILFGWAVVLGLTARLWIKPRIVPYFRRELGPYGGPTMVPFRRGRALYREFAALERLARTLDITPLSAFGFAYDHYEQEVRWHAAGAALRTVEALRAPSRWIA